MLDTYMARLSETEKAPPRPLMSSKKRSSQADEKSFIL